MRLRLLVVTFLTLWIMTATPAFTQGPVATPTDAPQSGGMSDSSVKLIDIAASAMVALAVAVGGWLFQSRQFRQTLQQKGQELAQQQAHFEQTMQVEWLKVRELIPLESRLESWLATVEIPRVEKQTVCGNPYIVGPSIVDPRDFYGRRELVDSLFEVVVGRQVTSVEVLGARRSGKTSLLNFIGHPDTLYARHYHSVIFVYVNLQSGFGAPKSFFSHLLGSITRAFEHHTKVTSLAPDLPGEIDSRVVEKFLQDACDRGWRFVLLLDEFERLATNDGFDATFFGNLRSLATGREVALVTVSFRGFRQEQAYQEKQALDKTSPLFNIFSQTPLYVGAMEAEDARKLITEPARQAEHPFSPEDVDFISALAGRLPFALQAAASMLYQAHREGKTGQTAQPRMREAFLNAMEKHFDHYWTHFTQAERDVLHKLVGFGGPTPNDLEALNTLMNYGFVEKSGDDYHILGDAFIEWVSQEGRRK